MSQTDADDLNRTHGRFNDPNRVKRSPWPPTEAGSLDARREPRQRHPSSHICSHPPLPRSAIRCASSSSLNNPMRQQLLPQQHPRPSSTTPPLGHGHFPLLHPVFPAIDDMDSECAADEIHQSLRALYPCRPDTGALQPRRLRPPSTLPCPPSLLQTMCVPFVLAVDDLNPHRPRQLRPPSTQVAPSIPAVDNRLCLRRLKTHGRPPCPHAARPTRPPPGL